MDYVIRSGVKLDAWCKDALYAKYLQEMLQVEPIEAAIQRSLETMIEWGDRAKTDYTQYFKKVPANTAVNDICNGRISAWILLSSSDSKKMLEGFNDDQLNLISPTLDMRFWVKRFKDNPADVAFVYNMCTELRI